MPTVNQHPFVGEVAEVPLPQAPLAKVLTQIRYPRPLTFAGASSIEPTRQALAERYPVARQGKAMSVLITPEGVTQQPGTGDVWTLESIDGSWKVTLADQFVALETNAYRSRSDFCDRIDEIVGVMAETISPVVYDRLGLRYINRLVGEQTLDSLAELVQPVALAGLSIPRDGVQLAHSLCDSLFIDGDARLQARWGWLPAGAAIDTAAEPPSAPHWLLDIDVFTETRRPFEAAVLGSEARDLAARAHRFFRWAVTEEFLKRFGGQT